jgi:cullin 3
MLNSGLDTMIDHERLDDLSRLYHLYSMVPEGIPCLRRSLKDSVQKRGTELNGITAEERQLGDGGADEELDPSAKGKGKAKARPPNTGAQGLALALRWVEDVLQLKDKFDRIWEMAFKNNREIESGLNEVIDFCLPFMIETLTYSRHLSRLSTCAHEPRSLYPFTLMKI